MYYYALKPTNQNIIDYTFAQTVAQNKLLFTKRQIENAEKAQILYDMIGRGGQQRFLNIIRDGELKNCPVTMNDAKNAFIIFGKNLHSIRGGTIRSKTEHVPSNQLILSLLDILTAHNTVTLCIDYTLVEKLFFS